MNYTRRTIARLMARPRSLLTSFRLRGTLSEAMSAVSDRMQVVIGWLDSGLRPDGQPGAVATSLWWILLLPLS